MSGEPEARRTFLVETIEVVEDALREVTLTELPEVLEEIVACLRLLTESDFSISTFICSECKGKDYYETKVGMWSDGDEHLRSNFNKQLV